ncbi:5-methyltetrahydropteroyltriglutamate--homocysteine S-methyltransferase, partial [Arthrospira sp. PCC 8006]
LDLTAEVKVKYQEVYQHLRAAFPELKIILANYFDCYGDNLDIALSLPVEALHLDLGRCPSQLDDILAHPALAHQALSLGLVDGRNIWKNNYQNSLTYIRKAMEKLGEEKVWLAPSCSLLHSPYDLDLEIQLDPELKDWLSFGKQKLNELKGLKEIAMLPDSEHSLEYLKQNKQ